MKTVVIEIDCAVQSKNVGLALGYFDGIRAGLEQVVDGSMVESIATEVSKWILTGIDFLRGKVYFLHNPTLARKEGWIWVRRKLDG